VSTRGDKFVATIKCCNVRFTNNKILFPDTQVTSLGCIIVRFSMFLNFPFDRITNVIVLKIPDVFT
jgi:hypothetical protein